MRRNEYRYNKMKIDKKYPINAPRKYLIFALATVASNGMANILAATISIFVGEDVGDEVGDEVGDAVLNIA